MSTTFHNVLLVEDEPQLAIMAEQLLRDLGIEDVRIAEDAAGALRLAARQRYELLICDLSLPGKDGLWLLREISALTDPPAVILLSGVDPALLRAAESLAREMGLNVLGALSKPLTVAAFNNMLSGGGAGPSIPERRRQTAETELVPDAVLLQGLERHWYHPHFEARIAADTGEVEGGEVLARLLPPMGKPVVPEHFIRRLETMKLIGEMTWQVADPALALAREFVQGGRPFSISLNISAQMLTDDALLERLDERVAAHSLDPRSITLEITESVAVDSSPLVLQRLVHLRLRGYGLAIDDFGTGFSSLAQLSKLPFTEMKIDRIFSNSVASDAKARAVVESSIGLARRLGMKTCAEGVDSAAVYRLLREMGADRFQGYHFHRPLPAREFVRWVQEWKPADLT